MDSSTFWKAVLVDRENLLDRFLEFLKTTGVRYCVVGGMGVNAYAYPVVTEDLDIAVATADLGTLEAALTGTFAVRRFPHSLNISAPDSKLQIQIRTDERYGDFAGRAQVREVMGYELPVARMEDVLQGKVWAALDSTRRPSKQLKDLSDIARMLEAAPALRDRVPPELLARIPAQR
ncbi:MAG: hypothetical protein HY657_00010 [Acidobacteria bacterium]|nr:hypothetical protein [Acidobacteriota bacterium]